MSMCPVCNGLNEVQQPCQHCSAVMEDCGKTVDYLDDYSAYMDMQQLEKVDGMSREDSNQYCLHLYHCPSCGKEVSIRIQQI